MQAKILSAQEAVRLIPNGAVAGYRRRPRRGDGDVNWPEVRRALDEIAYEGTVIAELDEGDLAYLSDGSKRIDRLLF